MPSFLKFENIRVLKFLAKVNSLQSRMSKSLLRRKILEKMLVSSFSRLGKVRKATVSLKDRKGNK